MSERPEAGKRVAVIGAGPMGLAAAYELAKSGYRVKIFERDDRIGGQSAMMDFAGLRIERYYHFVCKPDHALFEYLAELRLTDRLRWVETKMGFYYQNALHSWGNPVALLRFPHLSLVDKFRYGLHVMFSKSIDDWRSYDAISAKRWIKSWVGPRTFDVLWRSLFEYKFYELDERVSAAWIGTRIKRVALSRKSLMAEELGYIEGGSEVLLEAVLTKVRGLGGKLALSSKVDEITSDAGGITGVRTGDTLEPFDFVVSTVPMPYLGRLCPGLPPDERARINAIKNVGVTCVLLRLKRPFTKNFWLNIGDPEIEIPGFIEYSNLNPLPGLDGGALLYAPYYMPTTHAKYTRDKREFIGETIAAMKKIRPDFDEADVVDAIASRYEYAQPVCEPGFYEKLPDMTSKLRGLFLADTSHGYPEDRSISDSIGLGRQLASRVEQAFRERLRSAGTGSPAQEVLRRE